MISSIRCGVGGPDLRLGDGVNVLIERGPVPVDVYDSDEFHGGRFTTPTCPAHGDTTSPVEGAHG